MRELIVLVVGLVVGASLRGIPAWWRAQRRAQAAQKPEYADGQWFADTTPPPPLSQAQIADAPQVGKISFRSVPGRRRVRRTGR